MGATQSKKKLLYQDLSDDKKIRRIWAKIDTNNANSLSAHELQAGLKNLNYSEESISELLRAIQLKEGAKISHEEFNTYISTKRAQLRATFESLDHKHEGSLDEQEVKAFMERMNLSYDDEAVKKLFNKMDRNHDGRIQLDEWQALLLLAPQTEADALFRYWGDALARDIDDEEWELAGRMRSYRQVLLQGAAGAGSGMISRTATAPLERLKILYQIHVGKPQHSLWTSFLHIYKDGGVGAYFRGNGANVLKVAPESAIKFSTFEAVKRLFSDNDADITPGQRAIAGAAAGVVTHSSMFPLEVIKTRLAAAPNGFYGGIVDCVRQTARAEGRFLPFYRGLSASLMSTLPHASVDLAAYETFKHAAMRWYSARSSRRKSTTGEQQQQQQNSEDGKDEETEEDLLRGTPRLPAMYLMACAGAASTLSQSIAYPFHLVKTRYIAQGSGGRPRIYSGLFEVFRQTYQKEGVVGFYRGITPSFMKSIPAHMVTYTCYDYFKRVFGIEGKKHHKH